MSIKSNDLVSLEKCEKKYELDKLQIVNEKEKYYYISIAIKKIIKEILESGAEIELENIKKKLDTLLPNEVFLPLVKGEILEETANQIFRYLNFLLKNGYKLIDSNVTQDINIKGELISVSADFVFKIKETINLVKIERKAPELSYRARKSENMPENNSTLYLIYLMGKHLYPNDDILASFHCMTGKKDDKEEEYPQYEENPGDNIISINFEKVKGAAKERLVELIERTKKSEFSKTEDTNNCRVCPYINVCNYTKPKDIKLDLIKKITKASNDFSLTDSQRKAVIFEKGIARINAGAGSGKTTTIALRVANLILSGYKPEDILLITFTNKGAAEMKEKTAYWLKKEGVEINKDRLNITTFNSWGNEIIMENYKELGFTASPVLIEKVQKYDLIFD